jgi:hypothetical protein
MEVGAYDEDKAKFYQNSLEKTILADTARYCENWVAERSVNLNFRLYVADALDFIVRARHLLLCWLLPRPFYFNPRPRPAQRLEEARISRALPEISHEKMKHCVLTILLEQQMAVFHRELKVRLACLVGNRRGLTPLCAATSGDW